MMVPAVTDVCLPQCAHSQVHALVCSGQALPVPQAGQTKPFGQRAATRYRTQAALSGKRLWNSIRERGKSDMSGLRRAHVRSMFYHRPTLSTTANGGPGCTGISLFLYNLGTCRYPPVKNITTNVNSVFNSWRFEDAWLDK